MSTSSARLRWKFLSEVLVARSSSQNDDTTQKEEQEKDANSSRQAVQSVSTRRFTDFQLLQWTKSNTDGADGWYRYWIPDLNPSCPIDGGVFIRFPSTTSLEDIGGFDNTGNICVWPSEQALAYVCAHMKSQFSGKSVCELGGGMTGLAGNMIAACSTAKNVLLTDGNVKSAENCAEIVQFNKKQGSYYCQDVSARCLRWDRPEEWPDGAGTFDFVIAADCLFVADFRQALCDCIAGLLSDKGEVLILAPRRNNTLADFVNKAGTHFTVQVLERYNDVVWNLHQRHVASNVHYTPDLHYPLLLRLHRKLTIPSL